MIRFALIAAACVMLAAPATAQTRDEILGPGAWRACQQARATAHAVTPDSTPATRALGEAGAQLTTVPQEYRAMFQATYDQIKTALDAASRYHGRGDGLRAGADGSYTAIARRVASGNWLGVTDAANNCATDYRQAEFNLTQASIGYGYVEQEAKRLKQDIIQFVAMLEAFEDFYGPIP